MNKEKEENKSTVTIKRLYWKFLCTDKNDYKNKTNLPSPQLPPQLQFS